MQRLKSYIALFLLLLFVRVMIPDTLLLALHSHDHTEHDAQHDTHQAEIGKKHLHCAVADLFGAPYQPALNTIDFAPVVHATAYYSTHTGTYRLQALFSSYLRGPPQA